MKARFAILILLAASLCVVPSFGQESSEGFAEKQATNKNDKSGTNPINFQRDLRIYNEYLRSYDNEYSK